ncbi:MAG: 50S ribosomal protein L25/general stress protein Ctc [Gemmatimonadota bacterium]|nr:MAG: 50S ribosomal protein L25/general stress protein Ctc [Gemmatimonadota bacterium]
MRTKVELAAVKRGETGKGAARKIRRAGRVPAVVYGKDLDAMPLTVDGHEALKLFQSISVENTIVSLAIEGEEDMDILVREIQSHPFRTELIHVDFYQIQTGVAIEVDIPVILMGTSEGVRTGGGIMDQIIHEVRVKCIPSLIPESFEVEVTALEVGDSLLVSGIPMAEDVELISDLEQTICMVALPKVVEVDEPEEELEEGEEGAELAEGEEAPAAEGGSPSEEGGDEDGSGG